MSALEVALWRGPETEDGDMGIAVEALSKTLNEQIPYSVNVDKRGTVALDGAPYDSYREYLDGFEEEADLQQGAVNLCLYYWFEADVALDGILEALEERDIISCSPTENEESKEKINQEPWCGYDNGELAPDQSPAAVVNTLWDIIPLSCTYENFVIHEVLHAVLENEKAPQQGNDDSYGDIIDDDATPMATGYVEPISTNPKPQVLCNHETVPTMAGHTTTLSDCTKDEIERRMTELYGPPE